MADSSKPGKPVADQAALKREHVNARRRLRRAEKRVILKQQAVLALLAELKSHLTRVEWDTVSER